MSNKVEISRRYTGTLEVLSPLHLGSGDFGERPGVEGKDGANKKPLVALIARDAHNTPYIPGSSLKGILVPLMDEVHRGLLQGTIKHSDTQRGQMGALQVRGARLSRPGEAKGMPYVHGADATDLGAGVFIAARTSIDGATGTASDAKLFFHEMVARGAEFTFDIVAAPRQPEDLDDVCAGLEQVLQRLAAPEGVSIGKGQADGFGRIRLGLKQGVTAISRVVDAGVVGEAPAQRVTITAAEQATGPVLSLKLHCADAFIITDASRNKKRVPREGQKTDTGPQQFAQQQGNLPFILGSSLSGALRARAAWLAAIHGHGPVPDEILDGDALPKHPVNRLFGVTGFRGLLGLGAVVVETATPWDVTSVKIDRFSGAPFDNALFTTRTFVDVSFAVSLVLERRKGAEANADDLALLKALKADLETNGLQLGAGENKGFGWFDVEVASFGLDVFEMDGEARNG